MSSSSADNTCDFKIHASGFIGAQLQRPIDVLVGFPQVARDFESAEQRAGHLDGVLELVLPHYAPKGTTVLEGLPQ